MCPLTLLLELLLASYQLFNLLVALYLKLHYLLVILL
jgi:hypothetical protein